MNVKELLRKCQLLLIIVFGSYPAVMVLFDHFAPDLLPYGWTYPAAFFLLSVLGILVPGKWRLVCGILFAAGLVGISVWICPREFLLPVIAAAVFSSVLQLWCLQMGGWSSREEIPGIWISFEIVCHLIGQIFVYMDRVGEDPVLSRYSGSFFTALFGGILLTMLSLNRKSLLDASGKRKSVPGVMRQKNTVMTVGLFAVSILAALVPSVFPLIKSAVIGAVKWIVELVKKLIPDTPAAQQGGVPSQGGPPPMMMDSGGEPSMFAIVMEKVILFLGALLAAAGLVYLLYRLYLILRKNFKKLIMRFSRFAANVSEDYEDEVTDTRDPLTAEKIRSSHQKTRLSSRQERAMSPGERIRYRYLRLLQRHPEWGSGSTARENLPGSMASLYERARYSTHAVTQEEASSFVSSSKKI